MNTVGERLRTKALAELDYNRIAEELCAEYSRMERQRATSADTTDSRGLKEFG